MCGIAGFIGHETIPEERVDACFGLMHRRGPDHHEHRRWQTEDGRTVHLLHSRLNIIDLNHRADQPLGVNDKWIVFNGELYNHVELRSKLEALGRSFVTTSDTEVLLHNFDQLGISGLDRCEGMWAFAVYDQANETLTLARDRFSEKPLYLYRNQNGIFFGSEIKFLACLTGQSFDINFDQFYRYFVNGYRSLNKKPATFFHRIEELEPATALVIDSQGREKKNRYWTFRHQPNDSITYEEAVARTRELLIESMRIRLRSDVPIAFCMSGGVDSNSLISIAKRTFDYDVHGFTIIDEDPRYNETEMVDLAVNDLGVKHTSIPTRKEDFLDNLRILVEYHDAPVLTISYYAQWQLLRSVAEHGYRISISGTGADELFSGYFDHHLLFLNAIRDDPVALAEATANWETHIKPIVRNPLLQDPQAFIKNPGQREHIYLNADTIRTLMVEDWNEPFTETAFTDDLMRNRMLNEMFHEIVPVILHEDDLNAMFFSIENRSPFLDRRLFEFATSLPTRLLVRDGRAKAILRDAMTGIAPAPIMENRRKVGFNASILSFLDTRDPKVRDYLLEDSPIFEHVRRDGIEALIDKEELPNSESKFLFNFVSGKMFLERFAT